jgi:hypothetical protein
MQIIFWLFDCRYWLVVVLYNPLPDAGGGGAGCGAGPPHGFPGPLQESLLCQSRRNSPPLPLPGRDVSLVCSPSAILKAACPVCTVQ